MIEEASLVKRMEDLERRVSALEDDKRKEEELLESMFELPPSDRPSHRRIPTK